MKQTKTHKLFFLLFCGCIFALSLGQFSKIITLGQGNIYLFDILIALFDFVGLLYLARVRQLKTPLPLIFLLGFVALGTVSLVFTPLALEPSEFLTALAYPIRLLFYVLFALVITNFCRLKAFKLDQINRVIIYSGLFLFVVGIMQLILLPDLETLDPALGWDPHKNRMVSTFFDPNFLGMYFVICLATAFKLAHRSTTSSDRQKTLYPAISDGNPLIGSSVSHNIIKPGQVLMMEQYLYSAIFLLGIFLTFSRSAWLATAVLLFFVGLKNKTILLIATIIILLAVFAVPRVQTRLAGITDPQDSAGFRLISWQNTWEIIQDNWVFGVGYNAFRYAQQDYGFLDDSSISSRSGAGSDSSLLLVWATSGILGLMFVTGFFVAKVTQDIKYTDLTTEGLVFALLLNSIFINSIFYPQIIVVALLVFQTNRYVVD